MNLRRAQFYQSAFLEVIVCLFGTTAFAQENKEKSNNFCQQNNYNGDKSSFTEPREFTLPAGNLLTVDGEQNGGIRVKGADRNDVLVRACVQAWGKSDEAARQLASSVRIEKGSTIRASGAAEDSGWAVSYEIHIPRSMNLKLTTHNGGIGISGVEGTIDFEAVNGGIHLSEVAGDVKGRTANGGVNVELSGTSWRGAGLNVETTNGGVRLTMPETYAAHVETGTVNGGFKSSIAALNIERKDRSRAARLSADLNGGGATVRVVTTNGGVHIKTPDKSR